MDSLKNFAYSLVATPPSPATSGTSLVVTAGQGALFPAAPFDATIWPAGVQPLTTNAEIVRVTAVSTDTFTITRAQYGTTAQSITAGYQIAQTITANLLNQLNTTIAGALKASNNLSDVANYSTALQTLGGLPLAGGTMTGFINQYFVTAGSAGPISSPTALTAAYNLVSGGITNRYFALPVGNNSGKTVTVYNQSPYAAYIVPSGTDTIDGSTTAVTLNQYQSWTGVANVVPPANWQTVSGPNQFAGLNYNSFTGEISAPDFKVTGITGAAAGTTRLVGTTTSGPPTTGTFTAGDIVADQTGTFWICITGGTPGTWTNEVPNSLVVRSATATAGIGEFTIFGTSGTSGQTITLPASPQNGAIYQIKNLSAYTVNIKGGTNSVSVSGTVYGAAATYTIPLNAAYSFVFTGGVWFCFVTTDLAQMSNTVPTGNGGTGLTGFTAANNALYSTSSSALTAGTLPVLAGGTGVTTSTGSGSNVLSTSPSLTTPNFSSIVNSGTLTLPTSTDTLVGRATTDTLTNKRITKRVTSTTANASSYAINTDNVDVYHVTSQTTTPVQFTSTGTPVDGDTLRISMTGTTSIGLTWGTTFESSGGVILPVATAGTVRLDVGFVWDSETSKWRLVAVA